MKQTPSTVFIIIVLFALNIAFAIQVTQEMALDVASIFLDTHPGFRLSPDQLCKSEPFAISNISVITSDVQPLAYIAHIEPQGYIAVSADTDIEPIIAYSTEGDFVIDESHNNLPYLILKTDLALRKEAKPFTNSAVLRANNLSWNSYLNHEKLFISSISTTSIWGPWIDTNWGQSAPYNEHCPIDPEAGERSVTGCVATATSQIIDYWEYPSSATFNSSDSYWSESTSPRIWIDASTASFYGLDYRGAGRYPTSASIADLMWACGVSLQMQYSNEGSSSDTRFVPDALMNKFDYASASGMIILSTGFWDTLQANILIAQPVELGIGGMGVGGHAIVCDGYDTSDLYHLNMGWSGYSNGWYSLPEGMPADFTIVGHQAKDIIPPVITRRPPQNLNAKSITGGYIELSWNRPFNITEPVIGYKIYRKGFYDTEYTHIITISDTIYLDTSISELTGYTYAVSADYSAGESDPLQISVYSGIIGGWSRTYGGAGDQVPYFVAPAPGYGCIAVGYTLLSSTLDKDGYVLRTVAGSSPLWTTSIDRAGTDDCLYSVCELPDSEFSAAGYSVNDSRNNIWLVKLNDTGDTIWTRLIETSYNEVALSHIFTSEDCFVLAGYRSEGSIEYGIAAKTDANGDTIWLRNYYSNTRFNSVKEVSSGGFILAGEISPGPLGQSDVHIVRIDINGDTLWSRNFGGTLDDVANCITEMRDGSFVITGKTRSYGMPIFNSMLVMKISSSGDEIWTRSFVDMGDFEGHSVIETHRGTIFAAGGAKFGGNLDIYTIELNCDGDSLATHTYGTAGSDIAYSAVQLPDTGLVIAGKTFQTDNTDFWLLKIGGDLLSSVEETLPPVPENISLLAHPNPFNSAVSLSLCDIDNSRDISAQIYDITGKYITDLRSSPNSSNTTLIWTPKEGIGSGIYLVRVKTGGEYISKRIIYIK